MDRSDYLQALTDIVGRASVKTDSNETRGYRRGYRSGAGELEAVAIPGSLVELWRVLELAVRANRVVIMQAANTGLTEGSTPNGEYDRPVLVISTVALDTIHLLDEGRQIVSLPGGTLYELEDKLAPLGRQPHSVIGSSCIGASVIGGICNNSGGALVRRGPAYTELSVYARKTAEGRLELVNHIGIELGREPEEILRRLEAGDFDPAKIDRDPGHASDVGYETRVRDVHANSPARYNADADRLHEASGCAGKLAVFAVRLDTFPVEHDTRVYYLGTNDTAALTAFRRRMLAESDQLPISGEYMHRDIFDMAHRYGKDTLLMIHWLGTKYLPKIFALKNAVDSRAERTSWLPTNLSDRVMQMLSRVAPEALPKRMRDFRDRFEHHLILKIEGSMVDTTERLLDETIGQEGWFRCTEREAAKAMLHRFAAAGAAVRYQAVHPDEVEEIIALDIALRRNDEDWFESLPDEVDREISHRLYYGHFFCHVFHQDYMVKKGANAERVKQRMLSLLDRRGAKYPAEHNVGHLYEAEPALADFYTALDPTNSFNPGIGKTSKQGRQHAAG